MMKDLEALFSPAVTEVFTTMLNYPSLDVRLETQNAVPANGELHLASAVGIVGEFTGVLYLHVSATLARKLTCRLLHMTEQEVDSEEIVNDAMGEIANMVIGYIKSRLCEKGTVCAITIPSIVRGSHFSIEPVGVDERRLFMLKCDDGQFWAEALVKNDKSN
jgi:chemotaxis protein CheX